MVALRSLFGDQEHDHEPEPQLPQPDPADWLTLQQAACELNISTSTARRMIHKGRLRHRIVPRRGGFAYLVYLPDSRHKRLGRDACVHDDAGDERALRDLQAYARRRHPHDASRDDEVRQLEQQVERLSEALARALRTKQRQLPPGMGQPDVNPDDPYARYRWLVRRKRFGLF